MKDTPASAPSANIAHGLRAYLGDLAATLGRRRMAAATLLVLCSTLLDSLGLLLLVPLLQLVNGSATTPALQWLLRHGVQPRLGAVLLIFVGLMLVRAGVTRLREATLLGLRIDYVDALRRRLERALAMAPWERLAQIPHARVMHLLTDQLARVNLGTYQVMQLLSGAGLALAGVAVAAIIAPLWTALVLLPVLALVWAMRGRLASAATLGRSLSLGQRAAMASARDFLAGLKLVKAHGAEPHYLAEFDQRAERLRHEQLGFARHQAVTRGAFEAGGAALLATLLYGAATWGQLGLPELLLIVLVFSRLLPLVREGHLQLQQLAHTVPAFLDVQALIAACAAPGLAGSPAAAGAGVTAGAGAGVEAEPPLPLLQSLRLDGVVFRYAPSDAGTLSNVSLVLRAGTITALMGPSGTGKTTLADIAAGLLAPTEGSIWVDDRPLSDPSTLRRWRRSVAYVGQDAFLFAGSVRANLCWLTGPRPDADLWHALAQADAAGFVTALAGGLDQHLGERGEGLSGGERQRLALARALLGRPSLLILDEITSQLDAASEERVLQALGRLRGRTTMLLIAHREAVRRHADRVILLDGGRVADDSGLAADTATKPTAAVSLGATAFDYRAV